MPNTTPKANYSDWLTITFFLVLLIVPGGSEITFGITTLIGLLFLCRKSTRKIEIHKDVKVVLLVFLFWFLVKASSLFWSINLQQSISSLGTNSHFLLAYPAFLVISKSNKLNNADNLLFGLIIGTFLCFVWAICNEHYKSLDLQYWPYDSPSWIVIQKRFEAGGQNPLTFAGVSSIISIFLVLFGIYTKLRYLSYLAAILALTTLLLSYSRAPIITFIILLICSLSLSRNITIRTITLGKLLLIISSTAVITALAIEYLPYQIIIHRFGNAQLQIHDYFYNYGWNVAYSSIGIRLDMINAGIQSFLNNIFIGNGIGVSVQSILKYTIYPNAIDWYKHVHNSLLQILLELGLLGLYIFVILYTTLFRFYWRWYKKDRLNIAPILGLMMITGYIINGITNLVFTQGYLNTFFIYTNCYLLAIYNTQKTNSKSPLSSRVNI